MTVEFTKGQRKPAHNKVHDLLSKHSAEDPDGVNTKRELFLAMLKKQYGYTNDKAIDELERLLNQFYKMNRSIGIHRTRPNFRHPHTEKD